MYINSENHTNYFQMIRCKFYLAFLKIKLYCRDLMIDLYYRLYLEQEKFAFHPTIYDCLLKRNKYQYQRV